MINITKENIMNLISEQISSMELDEMGRRKMLPDGTIEPHPLWTEAVTLPAPKIFKQTDFYTQAELNNWIVEFLTERGIEPDPTYKMSTLNGTEDGKLLSIDPNIESQIGDVKTKGIKQPKYITATEDMLVQGIAVCKRVKESRNVPGIKIYLYDGYGYRKPTIDPKTNNKVYHKKDLFVLVSDKDPNRPIALLSNLARNRIIDSKWNRPEDAVMSSDTYTKRWLHYSEINKLFKDKQVQEHLFSCGLPPIFAKKSFDEPITHQRARHVYTPPNFNFTLSGLWPMDDVQTALDFILNFRAAIADGEEPPAFPDPEHMPRSEHYDTVNPGGTWGMDQKIAGAEGAEQTEKLKLWMKSIQGGALKFYIETNLTIIGSVVDNNMSMSATFGATSAIRSEGSQRANVTIEPFTPVTVNSQLEIPENVPLNNLENDRLEIRRGDKWSPEFQFFTKIYDDLLSKLKEAILQIDSDEVVDKYLMYEPDDIEAELNEQAFNDEGEPLMTDKQFRDYSEPSEPEYDPQDDGPNIKRGIGNFEESEWDEIYNMLKRNKEILDNDTGPLETDQDTHMITTNYMFDHGMLSADELGLLKDFNVIEVVNQYYPILSLNVDGLEDFEEKAAQAFKGGKDPVFENKKPKKIRITESQLKFLLESKKPKKIRITEQQLRYLMEL